MQMTIKHFEFVDAEEIEMEFDIDFRVTDADPSVGIFGRHFEDLTVVEIRVGSLTISNPTLSKEFYAKLERDHEEEILNYIGE